MKLLRVRLFNRAGDKTDSLTTIAEWSKPSVGAQNYYQQSQNVALKAIVTIHADADRVEDFDAIQIETTGKKLRIYAKSEPSYGTQRLECGV